MQVICFFKTPVLEMSIKNHIRKVFDPRQIYFEDGKNFERSKGLVGEFCIIIEDIEDFRGKNFENDFGICLFKDEKTLFHQKKYPNFIFLKKPIKLSLLLKTLLNLIHDRQKKITDDILEKFWVGPFVFEKSKRQLKDYSQERQIFLTEKETELLSFLLNCPEGRAKRAQILENIWNYAPEVATRTLESHIYALRKKIEQDLRNPQYLLTEAGGYRLVYSQK